MATATKKTREVFITSMVEQALDSITGKLSHFHKGEFQLCQQAFCQLYNISKSSLHNHATQERPSDQGYTQRNSPATGPAQMWLTTRLPFIADYSVKSTKFILPLESINKKELWQRYHMENRIKLGEPGSISQQSWYRMLTVFVTLTNKYLTSDK